MTEPRAGSAVARWSLAWPSCLPPARRADQAPIQPDGPAASPPAATAVATPRQAETRSHPEASRCVDLEVVTSGLQQPVAVAMPDDGSGDLYVVEQAGRIVRLPGGAEPSVEAPRHPDRVGSGGERGLLGLAFSPSVADDGRLFVDYTDDNGDTVIAEFRRRDDGSIDPDSERVVLQVSQPAANHNGGDVHFGPDGMLYIAFGDGGGGNSRTARRMDTLLGKILRLDVLGEPDAGLAYAVPPDNPFVGQAGVRPEIWATGLRNPWRFSIEPGSGALWIGDVGAGSREEIDYAPQGGLDFGWDRVEGTLCRDEAVCQDPDLVAPVAEYGHDEGCVVTGGLVYQGSAIDSLGGRYVLRRLLQRRHRHARRAARLRLRPGHRAAPRDRPRDRRLRPGRRRRGARRRPRRRAPTAGGRAVSGSFADRIVVAPDGTVIGAWRTGSGTPIVLVHGSADDHTAWDSVAAHLALRMEVHAIDRRGRGASPWTGPVYAIEQEFDDVAAVVDSTGTPTWLFGQGYGADIASGAALRTRNLAGPHPLRAGAGHPHGRSGHAGRGRAPARGRRSRWRADLDARCGPGSRPGSHRRCAGRAGLAGVGRPDGDDAARAAGRSEAWRPTGYGDLVLPTLLLLGSRSPAWAARWTAMAQTAIPESRLEMLDDQGHLALLTAPELVAGKVIDFVFDPSRS